MPHHRLLLNNVFQLEYNVNKNNYEFLEELNMILVT